MKIGILTYHRSNNYGALLQAIALRTVLNEMGHQVTFIDYWPSYHQHLYALFSFGSMKYRSFGKNIKYIVNFFKRGKYIKKRIDSFEEFRKTYIYPYLSTMQESYDLVVHGSDQIWRKQREIHKYNSIYFGKNKIDSPRQISYAASMGIVSCSQSEKEILKDYLSHLNSISVREIDLQQLVNELGYSCVLSLDPTLLIPLKKWTSIMSLNHSTTEKYLLFYNLLGKSFDLGNIREFAKRNNLRLKTLYGNAFKPNSEDEITIANPKHFLDLFFNAEFIITSSYHGLMFALLFHKQFYVSFSKNSGRAKSILLELGLQDRLLPTGCTIPDISNCIDYSRVEQMILEKKEKSLQYLQENLV